MRIISCPNKVSFQAEIADTWLMIAKGLMFRDSLEKNTGMLFIFPDEAKHSIWMFGMKFSLDILWLDKEGKIVTIRENTPPDVFLGPHPEYYPLKDAKYVLELQAGTIKEANLVLGDQFSLL